MICFGVTGKGTYWRALKLARGLARHGHTLTVMSTAPKERRHFVTSADKQIGVTLVESSDWMRGALRSGWDPFNTWMRLRWRREQKFDLVHAFESRPTVIYPALAWQRRGAKLILDWCDWFGKGGSVEERPNPLTRTVLRPVETYFEDHFRSRADGTTVINSTLRERATRLGIPASQIFDLPNGSDVDVLHPLSQQESRQQLGWSPDDRVIGYLGAIFQRDAQLLTQAFDRVRQQEPRARLLVAGYCNIALENLVRVPEAVIRTGPLSYEQINVYLAACDVCWLPLCDSGANRGRFPMKLSDYMAVGKPVVATAVGDVVKWVQQGEFGVLCQDTPDDLAEKTFALWRDSRDLTAMGQRGRDFAEREFRWEQIANRLERFYEDVLNQACQ